MDVLYEVVYCEGRVPLGCRNCYKVKVEVDRVVDLVALRKIAQQVVCISKCGTEVGNRYSQTRYSAFFYVDGLEQAFLIMDTVDALLSEQPALEERVRVSIKRGCTPYEMKLGPSDQWAFDVELGDVEARLAEAFKSAPKGNANDMVTYMGWIETAFSIGDDSYLELTHGKRLFPKTVDYRKRRGPE